MMNVRDGVHEDQQRRVPPRSLSSSYSGPAGTSAPQGENSGNGFYAPPGAPPPSNTFPPLSHTNPSSENHIPAPSLMSREESQQDPSGFPSSIVSFTPTSQPHLDDHSIGSTVRPLLQINPSEPSVSSQPHLATHRSGPRAISSILDEFPSHVRPAPAPAPSFPVHPRPPLSVIGPLNTHFPPHYAMPLSFQNQSFQPQFYFGYHPLESNQYVLFPTRQPPPYIWYQPSVEANPASYHQAQTHPIPIPHFATSNPTSHVRPYDGVHPSAYVPRIYSLPPGHFRSPQHFQPNTSQWHYGPGSSTESFTDGVPPQAHHHYPTDHGREGSRLHRDFGSFRPYKSERSPSSNLDPGANSITTTTSSTAISATASHSLEGISMQLQDSPKIETQELAGRSETGTSHGISDRSAVRRTYHPDPPPNRSKWVMWVGNVPSDTTHDELWRLLTHAIPVASGSGRSGSVNDGGVTSIFLIPRSNCAFVNYRSGEQLNHAIAEFSGRKLRPQDRRCPRLVCRERRREDDLRAGVGAQRGRGVHTGHVKHMLQKGKEPAAESALSKGRETSSPKAPTPSLASKDRLEEDSRSNTSPKVATTSPSSYASTSSSFLARHFPRRFFILKSLTQYDLDLSVERGVWATQKHNETILDQAYRTSREVMLIFSVNKSGEFYGYARMASGIFRSEYNISWAPRVDPSPPSVSSPSSSSFPAPSSPEQSKSPSSDNPQTYTAPDGSLPGVTLSPLMPFSDPDPPPALYFDSGESLSGKGGSSIVFSSDPEPSSTMRLESRRAGLRTKDARVGDAVNHGSRLQPVEEEGPSGNSVRENIKLPSAGIPPEALRSQEEGWGETFSIEWLSTQRAPFNRTRHLRNPWNHGREIKVSRDGTELEPEVGQRLIDEWSNLTGTGKRGANRKPATGAIPAPSGESKSAKEGHP